MARNQATEASATVAVSIPEGFKRSGSANAVGWFNQGKIGNILSGRLLGMFTRKDPMRSEQGGTSNFFQVQIDQDCEVRAERGEDAKMLPAKAGDVVNVNYGPKTKPWENFANNIQNGAVYQVYGAIIGGKIKIGGGRTMHNFDTYDKMISPPVSTDEGDFDGGAEETDAV